MALVNKIVPSALVALARQIDTAFYNQNKRNKQQKLEELEMLAVKYVPILKAKVEQVKVLDIDSDLADILNKFDFSQVNAFKMAIAAPIITKWVQQNLKLKK